MIVRVESKIAVTIQTKFLARFVKICGHLQNDPYGKLIELKKN